MSVIRLRPLTERDWLRPAHQRSRAKFSTTWSDTKAKLEHEVSAIARPGSDLVVMLDITEADLRITDGQLRANARPSSPAVAVQFESRKGPLLFRSDLYGHAPWNHKMTPWQCNVRAVALTLEALRAVDRHGATSSGEQYVGYRALPAAGQASSALRQTGPMAELALLVGQTPTVLDEWRSTGKLRDRVVRAVHPDRGGDTAAYHRAMELLGELGL